MNGPFTLDAGPLRIEFCRQADRLAHVVSLTASDKVWPLLESVEGSAEENWPPSPPFQEIRIEPRGAGRHVALLVGMAGTSHWSASVETDPALGQATFDVACRLRQPDSELASRYRAAPACTIEMIDSCLEVVGHGARLRLELVRESPDASAALAISGDLLGVNVTAPAATGARTVRWKYTFSLTKS